jgi:hypothetical protein
MEQCNTQHWTLDPRTCRYCGDTDPSCLNRIVVTVDISHTIHKRGHDDTKSVSKIDDTPTGKGEALRTKRRPVRELDSHGKE